MAAMGAFSKSAMSCVGWNCSSSSCTFCSSSWLPCHQRKARGKRVLSVRDKDHKQLVERRPNNTKSEVNVHMRDAVRIVIAKTKAVSLSAAATRPL